MGQFLTLVGLAALVIAGIGVGNGVGSYLASKRASIATLKVTGADSQTIFRIYMLQILAVASVAILVGLAVGSVMPMAIGWVAGDILPVAPGFNLHPLPLAVSAIIRPADCARLRLAPAGPRTHGACRRSVPRNRRGRQPHRPAQHNLGCRVHRRHRRACGRDSTRASVFARVHRRGVRPFASPHRHSLPATLHRHPPAPPQGTPAPACARQSPPPRRADAGFGGRAWASA